MAGTEDSIKRLEMRIAKLESLLERAAAPAPRQTPDISAEEMKAFLKVRDVVAADWGDFCGINDCFRCIVRCSRCVALCDLCIRRCDVECTCGPCNLGSGGLRGRIGRFSDLGD